MTRDELIELAFRQGILGDKETLSAEQISLGADRLNLILKRLVTKELTYWTVATRTLAYTDFTNNKATIDTNPNAVKVLDIRRISADASERIPIEMVARHAYMSWTPYVTDTSAPTEAFAHVKATTIDVYVWPGMGTYSLELDVQYQNELPTSGSTTLILPEHWEEAIIYELVVALGPTYGMSTEEWQKANMMRKELTEDANNYDNENTSLFIAPRLHE